MCVMTDLRQITAATIGPDVTLAQATQTMISRGVRLLLVVNRDDDVLGVITARDTQGERPIQMIQKQPKLYTMDGPDKLKIKLPLPEAADRFNAARGLLAALAKA